MGGLSHFFPFFIEDGSPLTTLEVFQSKPTHNNDIHLPGHQHSRQSWPLPLKSSLLWM